MHIAIKQTATGISKDEVYFTDVLEKFNAFIDQQVENGGYWKSYEGKEIGAELKYYWRKKNECLASFENTKEIYLNLETSDNSLCLDNNKNNTCFKTIFTEQEARDLLKDDFHKFEKVEVN